jgi:hypothetical protein
MGPDLADPADLYGSAGGVDRSAKQLTAPSLLWGYICDTESAVTKYCRCHQVCVVILRPKYKSCILGLSTRGYSVKLPMIGILPTSAALVARFIDKQGLARC